MKTIIKVLCVLMCLLMALSVLSACKKKDEPDNPSDSQTDPVGPSDPIDNPDQPDNPGTDSDLIDDQMRAKYPGMDVIGISYPEDLTVLMDIVNASANVRALTENTVYYLASDLVFNDGWSPVAAVRNGQVITPNQPGDIFEGFIEFYGIFDGNGHTISGLYIYDDEMISYDSLGFFGDLYGTVKDLTLENCFVGASIEEDQTLTDTAIGVLAGRLMGSGKQIENINLISSNVVFQGNVSPNLGGVIGAVEGDNNVLSNIAYSGRVILAAADGSYPSPAKEVVMAQLVGNANDNTIKMENCVAGGSLLGIEVKEEEDNFSGTNSGDITYVDCKIEEYAGGEAVSDAIEIYIPKDLLTLDPTKDYAGQTIRLMNDINFNPGWTPSGASSGSMEVPSVFWSGLPRFAGIFDGNGHTISGICRLVDLDRTSYVGGFVEVLGSKAVIKNLTIENSVLFAYTTSKNKLSGIRLGGLIARAELGGRIENVTVNMDVWAVGNVSASIDGIQAFEGISSTLTKENVYFYGATGNLELSAISGLFSELDPYSPDGYDEEIIEVYNAADLMAVMDRAQKGEDFESMTVRLMNDIDLNPGVDLHAVLNDETNRISFPAEPANVWLGIPTFKGVFDGNGYAISGLYSWRNALCQNSGSYGGFIDVASSGAIIKNLIIRNSLHVVNNTGDGAWGSRTLYTGGLVAKNSKPRDSKATFSLTVSNVYVDMDVVLLCSNHGTVGGILAFSVRHENETDESGKALSNYTSPYRLSNVVFAGRIINTNYTLKVPFTSPKDQFSMSQLVSDTNWGSEHQLSNVLVAGQIITGNVDGEGVNDIFGANTYNGVNASNIVVGRHTTTPKTAYNLKNKVETDTFNSSSWVYDVYLGYYVPQTISTMIFENGIGDVMSVDSAERETFVPASPDPDKIHISTAEELFALVQSGKDFLGQTIYLDADIDLNPGWSAKTSIKEGKIVFPDAPAVTWTAFKTFKGIFDGQGHTISGLYSYRTVKEKKTQYSSNSGDYGGFIDSQSDGAVKNLAILNSIHIVDNTHSSSGDAMKDDWGSKGIHVGGLAGTINKTRVKSDSTGDKYKLGNSENFGFIAECVYTDMEVWWVSVGHCVIGGMIGMVYAPDGTTGNALFQINKSIFSGRVGNTNALSGGTAYYASGKGDQMAMGLVTGCVAFQASSAVRNSLIAGDLVTGTTGDDAKYIHYYFGSDYTNNSKEVAVTNCLTHYTNQLAPGMDADSWRLTENGYYVPASCPSMASRCVSLIFDNAEKDTVARIGLVQKGTETGVSFAEDKYTVTIPATVTQIREDTFKKCVDAQKIVVEPGNTAYSASKNQDALIATESATLLFGNRQGTIPGGVTVIGKNAFSDHLYLTNVEIPNGITRIESGAFSGCTSLTGIVIPNSVTAIGNSSFKNCTALETLTFAAGSSLESIGNDAFRDCDALTSVTFPGCLTKIGDSAFKDCAILASVEFSADLKEIGANAFEDCVEIESITLPTKQLTTIGESAFDGCVLLTSIYIPACVTNIGNRIVAYCPEMEKITVDPANEIYEDGGNNCIVEKATKTLVMGCKTTVLPSDLEIIRANSFRGCSTLEKITIPASVTKIESAAFYNCTGLKELTFEAGSNLQMIGESAFEECAELSCDLSMPASLKNIYKNAFYGVSAVNSLTFAEDSKLESIGESAFESAAGLKVVELPEGMTSVGKKAFKGCKELETVTIPSTISSWGEEAFANCTALKKLTLTDGLVTLGKSAFYGCSALEKLDIPTSITSWSAYTFEGCTSLTQLTLPEGLTIIGEKSFRRCRALETLTIPNTITTFGQYAFENCTKLKTLTLPEGLTLIGSNAFNLCSALEEVTIPSTITKASSSFSNCSGLKKVIFSEGLKEIKNTFPGCKNLKSIEIPASVTTIPAGAFATYPALETITVDPNNETYHSAGNCVIETATKTVITGCKASVIPSDGSVTTIGESAFEDAKLGKFVVPATVTEIGEDAFAGSSLASIALPEGLTTIGESAFSDCKSLTAIRIPASVTSFGAYAFEDCTNLYYVELTNGLAVIGESAFVGCSNLSSVTIPASITDFGAFAFEGCAALRSVRFSDGLNAIGEKAFRSCLRLQEVIFLGSVKVIGASAFECDINLARITLPVGLTTIQSAAFKYCTSLESITLPSGLTTIGSYAFDGCIKLTRLVLPEGLTTIGGSAFEGLTNLKSVTFPSTLTTIGDSAFKGCTVLATVSGMENTQLTTIGTRVFQNCAALGAIAFPDTLITIDNYAFDGCANLKLTVIPANVYTIGMCAFRGCTNLTDLTFEYAGGGMDIQTDAFGNVETVRGGIELLQGAVLPGDIRDMVKELIFVSGGALSKNMVKDFPVMTSIDLTPVTLIKTGAFKNCPSLTTITIPKTTTVEEGAFSNMIGITSYIVEEGNATVKAIDGNLYTADGSMLIAYAVAKTADTYIIPEGVTAIGAYAFNSCASVTSMTYVGTMEEFELSGFTVSETAFDQPTIIHCTDGDTCAIHTIVVDEAAVDATCTKAGNTGKAHCEVCGKILIAEEEIEALGHDYNDSGVCKRCGALKPSEGLNFVSNGDGTCYVTVVGTYEETSVVIPAQSPAEDTVTGIGDNAFKGLAEITSITLPDTLISIGDYAFAGTSIESISIPATVTSIGEGAFANCASLVINASTVAAENTKYKSEGSTTAGIYEKDGEGNKIKLVRLSTDRTSYALPSSIANIDPYAFSCCTKLISISASGNASYKVVSSGLYNKTGTTLIRARNNASFTINADTVHIAPSAFSGCDKLTKITLISTIEDIGDEAFLNCTKLATVTNSTTNLKHVGTDAFKGTPVEATAPTGSED